MTTLKEIVEKYGYGCKVKWTADISENIYIDTLVKSSEKRFEYRLIGNTGSYTDFPQDSDFQVEYVSGGNKMQKLSRMDLQTIDDLSSRVMEQLKKEVLNDIKDYAENDLPELIDDLVTKKGSIKLNNKIVDLAEIAQLLMQLNVSIDDYTYEQQEIKK